MSSTLVYFIFPALKRSGCTAHYWVLPSANRPLPAAHPETQKGVTMHRTGNRVTASLWGSFVRRRLLPASFLAALFFSAAAALAANYSCGNASSNHCYGQTSWSEQTQYFGAYVDLKEPTMNCPSSCGGFVDNEIWLIDNQSQACLANSFNQCWVEAGYIAQAGGGTQFFWADSRPQTSSTFNLHIVGDADPVGTTDHFMIVKDGRVSPQVFQVFIYNTSESTLYHGTSVASNGNPMSGNAIHIGQELAGTSGATAGDAEYTRNIWAVQALGPEYVFWYNRQTDDGSVRSDNPPSGSWSIDPSNPSPEGGDFTTHCCG